MILFIIFMIIVNVLMDILMIVMLYQTAKANQIFLFVVGLIASLIVNYCIWDPVIHLLSQLK